MRNAVLVWESMSIGNMYSYIMPQSMEKYRRETACMVHNNSAVFFNISF